PRRPASWPPPRVGPGIRNPPRRQDRRLGHQLPRRLLGLHRHLRRQCLEVYRREPRRRPRLGLRPPAHTPRPAAAPPASWRSRRPCAIRLAAGRAIRGDEHDGGRNRYLTTRATAPLATSAPGNATNVRAAPT